MSLLVADCPRCRSKKITFDMIQDTWTKTDNWIHWYETFCVCRHCRKATIFVVRQKDYGDREFFDKSGPSEIGGSADEHVSIEAFISLRDFATVGPPDHLPENIEAAFKEGATCLSVGCYNASSAMFRLCVDIATRSLLPEGEVENLNARTRRSLGLRLPWLFNTGRLPETLRELSTCIKEDGNDGAHEGSLSKADADDLLDFTTALLERMYTEPERLRLAQERRDERRGKQTTT